MEYNFLPAAAGSLVLFILVSLFSVWGISEHDKDTVPPSMFTLIFGVVGIGTTLIALINL